MVSLKEIEQNLMVVEAIEGYAYLHNLSTQETYWIFRQADLITLIRDNYGPLHSQDIEESIYFCEDVLRRLGYGC